VLPLQQAQCWVAQMVVAMECQTLEQLSDLW